MRPGLWSTPGPQGDAVLVLEVDRERYHTEPRYHAAVERLRIGGLAAIIDGDPL